MQEQERTYAGVGPHLCRSRTAAPMQELENTTDYIVSVTSWLRQTAPVQEPDSTYMQEPYCAYAITGQHLCIEAGPHLYLHSTERWST